MPTTGPRFEDKLIELFLSVYDDESWAGSRSLRCSPERAQDGGVEMLAKRVSDGLTLAIEHTLIEAFPGEKTNFSNGFARLQRVLRADPSNYLPKKAIYLEMPVDTLPVRSDWQAIIRDVSSWVGVAKDRFPEEATVQECPCPHHPKGSLSVRVHASDLGESSESFLIIHRYGETRIGDCVETALRRKLTKLAATPAERRILMLERDQIGITPRTIHDEVERQRPGFPRLADVTEIWIADTASFEEKGAYAEFVLFDQGEKLEAFAFYAGALLSRWKRGRRVQ